MAQLYVNGKALTQSVDAMTNYNTAFSNAAHGLVIGGVSILGGAALGRVIGALRGVVGSLFGTSATVIETTGSALPVGDEPYSGPNGMQDGGAHPVGTNSASANIGNATNVVRPGGTVELFTDVRGPKISGAVGVGPTDPTAVAPDATNMPNIPSNSQARVVANNPFIPTSSGGTGTMMNYLPEAARITEPGGDCNKWKWRQSVF